MRNTWTTAERWQAFYCHRLPKNNCLATPGESASKSELYPHTINGEFIPGTSARGFPKSRELLPRSTRASPIFTARTYQARMDRASLLRGERRRLYLHVLVEEMTNDLSARMDASANPEITGRLES